MKNLFCWTDSYRSFYLLILVTLVYFVVSSVPTRLLLHLLIVDCFETSHGYYHHNYSKNTHLLEVVYAFLVQKYYPEHYHQHQHNTHFKHYLRNNNAKTY